MEMIEIDADIERRKNSLTLKSDFNLVDVMSLFDRDNKGCVNLREFEEVFDLFKIHPNHSDLRLLF
jgi:hypothetical protein